MKTDKPAKSTNRKSTNGNPPATPGITGTGTQTGHSGAAALRNSPARVQGATFEQLSAVENAILAYGAVADGLKAQLVELISQHCNADESLVEDLNRLLLNFTHSFGAVQKNAEAELAALFAARNDQPPTPTPASAPAPFDAEKVFKHAIRSDVNCYAWIAGQPGIRVSAPGLWSDVVLSEAQALNFVCTQLGNWDDQIMRMTFNQWPEQRQSIADALLLAEAVLVRNGCDWANAGTEGAGAIATNAQLFALVCNSVSTFEELTAVFAARDREYESREAKRAADAAPAKEAVAA